MMSRMRHTILPLVLLVLAALAWWAFRAISEQAPSGPGVVTRLGDGVEAVDGARADPGDPAAGETIDAEERTLVDAPVPSRGVGALEVRVVGPDDDPLPHVAVTVVARDGRDEESTRRRAVTDERGEVLFDQLEVGPWSVASDRTLGGREQTPVVVHARVVTSLTLHVGVGVDARVRALDADGGRVPGADILLWPGSGQLDIPTSTPGVVVGRTDAQGELLVRALPYLRGHGSWFVARHPSLGESIARMVTSPANDDDRATRLIELRLGLPGALLDLRVVGPDGRPIAGATASARPVDVPSSEQTADGRVLRLRFREAQTDASGRATLQPLGVGDYLVRVRAAGHAAHSEALQVRSTERLERDVRLEPAARVHGVVVGRDRAPVPGAQVVIQLGQLGGRTITGPDGRFAIDQLGAGRAAWIAMHDEHARTSGGLELVAGLDSELEIAMSPLAVLHGRVVDPRGAGLEGWAVVATADLPGYQDDIRRGQTDADGVFRLAARDDVDYGLDVAEPGQVFGPPIPDLGTVRTREEPWVIRIPDDALAMAFVEGFLFDRDGTPAIDGMRLSLQGDGPGRAWFGNTAPPPEIDAATGRFRLGPFPPGPYSLWFARRDRFEFPVPVVLRPRQTTQLGRVEVPATGSLAVMLEAEPDLVLGDVMVQLDSERGSDIMRIDREGLTARRDLLPGRYEATVYGEGFCWLKEKIEISAGETQTLRGTLRPAIRVGLRFHMPEGEDGATFEILDRRGDLIWDVELEAGLASEDWWPHLSRGTFDVEATGASGRRYAGRFQVESLERSETPVDVRVEPVR